MNRIEEKQRTDEVEKQIRARMEQAVTRIHEYFGPRVNAIKEAEQRL